MRLGDIFKGLDLFQQDHSNFIISLPQWEEEGPIRERVPILARVTLVSS